MEEIVSWLIIGSKTTIKIKSVPLLSILAIKAPTGVTAVDAQPIASTVQLGAILTPPTGTHISQALIILLQPFSTLPLLFPSSPIPRPIPLFCLLVGLKIDFTLAPILAVQAETIGCTDRPLLMAGTVILHTLTPSTPTKFIHLVQQLPLRLLVRLL